MCAKHIILLKLIVLTAVFSFSSKAQYAHLQLHLSPGKKKLLLKTFPFTHVVVLDNRYDTSRLFTTLTTDYSHRYITLDTPATVAVRTYIETATASALKGDKMLLINIKVMGVPNRNAILFKNERSILNSGYDMRKKLLLQADAYYSTGDGSYRKILSFAGIRTYYNDSLTKTLGDLLDVFIRCIGYASAEASSAGVSSKGPSTRRKDSNTPNATVIYARDTTPLTIEQIDVQALQRWTGYPILHASTSPDGVYGYFSDLRDNNPKPDPIRLEYDPVDSIYRLKKGGYGQSFAIRNNGRMFIQIYRNIYVPLYRDKDRLRFYVPRSLPDIYGLLCLDIVQHSHSQTVTTGTFLGDLVGGMVIGAMQDRQTNKAAKNVTANGLRNDYRYGIIDLDTGDILYSDEEPVH